MNSQPPPFTAPTPGERAAVAAILIAFVLVNLLTASRSPTVWQDEVQMADPSINLATGHGVTSTAHAHRIPGQRLLPLNGMMYVVCCAAWVKMFGVGPTTVRSLTHLFAALAGLLVWLAVVRGRWLKTSWARLLLLAVVLSGYGITFAYRGARYDTPGMPLFAAALLASTSRNASVRSTLLVLLGILLPWGGLQLLPAAVAVCGLALIFGGRRTLPPLLCFGAGVALGCASVVAFFKGMGVWTQFVQHVQGAGQLSGEPADLSGGGKNLGSALRHWPNNVLRLDYSVTLLIFACACLAGWNLLKNGAARTLRGPAVAGLAVSLAVPLVMGVAGRYPIYYAWLTYLPLAVCATVATEHAASAGLNRLLVAGVASIALLASFIGLPLRLALTALEWRERDYGAVERFVYANVRPDDHAICSYAPYYPIKTTAADIFLPLAVPSMTPAERARLSVMVCERSPDGSLPKELQGLGDWVPTGAIFDATSASSGVPGWRKSLGARPYQLAVYRRPDEAATRVSPR